MLVIVAVDSGLGWFFTFFVAVAIGRDCFVLFGVTVSPGSLCILCRFKFPVAVFEIQRCGVELVGPWDMVVNCRRVE